MKQNAAAAPVPQEALNGIRPCRRVELQLALAKIAEAEFVHRGRADRRGVRDVDLLGARGVVAGKIAGRGAGGLEFRERVERVVVVEVIVDRRFSGCC